MSKRVKVTIQVQRSFPVDDEHYRELVEDGIIPDSINARAPKQVPGWGIVGMEITDQESGVKIA
jgi:hypothetical protein